jgi:hypothetical protein
MIWSYLHFVGGPCCPIRSNTLLIWQIDIVEIIWTTCNFNRSKWAVINITAIRVRAFKSNDLFPNFCDFKCKAASLYYKMFKCLRSCSYGLLAGASLSYQTWSKRMHAVSFQACIRASDYAIKVLNVKLIRYQFWCTRCAFRLLKVSSVVLRPKKLEIRKNCENCSV